MTVGLNRKTAIAVAKLLFGLGLIAVLLSTVDLAKLLEQFRTVDPGYLLAMFVLPHVAMLLSTIKWQILLNALAIRIRLYRLFNLYMIGTFFSNFLPTMVGGDVVKTYTLYRETGRASSVSAATFLERFVGLTALVTLLPFLFFDEILQNAIPQLDLMVAGVIAGFLVVLILVFSPVFDYLGLETPKNRLVGKVWTFVRDTHDNVRLFRHHKLPLVSAYLLSLVFYAVTVATTWSAAQAMGVQIDYFYLTAAVPVVLLIAFVPISLNGLGVTEAGYVVFFQLAGASPEDALAIALLLRFRLIITAAIGGLIFLRHRPEMPVTEDAEKPGELATPPKQFV